MGLSQETGNIRIKGIPTTIRDLLKQLVERKVTIILDAEDDPERVEIEAVVGDLLVAETEDRKFKFVDIDCICAVIVSREELLESIFGIGCPENDNDKNGRVLGLENNFKNCK